MGWGRSIGGGGRGRMGGGLLSSALAFIFNGWRKGCGHRIFRSQVDYLGMVP